METGYRAAGDGNKQEREQVARPDRSGTINKFGQRRIVSVGRMIRIPTARPTIVPIFRKVER